MPASWSEVPFAKAGGVRVHWLDDDTAILRQDLSSHFEAPFMYLLVGTERALLVDTGAGGISMRNVIDELIGDFPLVVANSHGHHDHIQGNAELAERANTEIIGVGSQPAAEFFGIESWPNGVGAIDLGGRRVEVLPVPGHTDDHLAFYDQRARVLLTGDALYAGRLYVRDVEAFRRSIARLSALIRARPVRYILGSHIELSSEGHEFPEGDLQHSGERHLELHPSHVRAVERVLGDLGAPQACLRTQDFVLVPLAPMAAR